MSFRFLELLIFLCFFLGSCSIITKDRPDISDIIIDLEVKRLDQSIMTAKSESDIQKVINENRDAFNLYLDIDKLPSDSIISRILLERVQNTQVDSFYLEVEKIFEDWKKYESDIERMFKYVKHYYPTFTAPRITTFFTAFLSERDIVISKSDVIIGLEYFLGKEASYIPAGYPGYILERYQPGNLVHSFIGLGVSNFFNETDYEDQSLVAEMIYHGKAYYFVSKVNPDLDEADILGFKKDEISYLETHEKEIWSYFVEKNLLFQSDRIENSKYINERPKTLEIDADCPGRVGRWLGYQMVKSYLNKNSDVDLQALMAYKNASAIFNESGYNPSL